MLQTVSERVVQAVGEREAEKQALLLRERVTLSVKEADEEALDEMQALLE